MGKFTYKAVEDLVLGDVVLVDVNVFARVLRLRQSTFGRLVVETTGRSLSPKAPGKQVWVDLDMPAPSPEWLARNS